jgi:NAD(P)-dependent dehydrogenase (short-subunit alcohol dehydrogenase family)
MLLSDRVCIITGGANGIGKGIALKFAIEGCSVVVADISEKEAERSVDKIKREGKESLLIKCDHADPRQVQSMTEEVVDKFGRVDILVNNAGGFGLPTPITELTEEAWDRNLALNLKGVFLCCKSVAPHMMAKKYGKIINIASIAAITAGPPAAHYTASKGGVPGVGSVILCDG